MTNGHGYVIKPEFTENADTIGHFYPQRQKCGIG